MGALLRQPGGSEGPRPVGVRGHTRRLSAAKAPNIEVVVPDIGAASLEPPAVSKLDHDELVIGVNHVSKLNAEVVEEERTPAEALVRKGMGSAYELEVPLDVSVGFGRSWNDAAH